MAKKPTKTLSSPVPAFRGNNKVGSLFFVLGTAIAVIGGLIFPSGLNPTLSGILIVLGIVVGLLNVTRRETDDFLMASVSLVIITALGGAVLSQVPQIGAYLEGVLLSILTFVVPST